MRPPHAGYAALFLLVAPYNVLANYFQLKDTFIGEDFLDGFNWDTENDPTHGVVNYVNQQTALAENLTSYTDTSFTMRANSWSKVAAGARGRDSIRIISNNSYSDSVVILDVQHMPTGCGTWPAFWMLSQKGPWPIGGEIDIVEGVNTGTQNLASLHTTANCTLTPSHYMTGNVSSTDCNAADNGNQGCGISFNKPNSLGAPFNRAGGGWYVLQRTAARGAYIWFWSRNDPNVPFEVRYPGTPTIYPNLYWGEPEARFPTTTCDFSKHFDAAQIIFDLTFCGDWAGNVFSQTCPGSCTDFVINNPSNFTEAYWEINSLRVYTLVQQTGFVGSNVPTVPVPDESP